MFLIGLEETPTKFKTIIDYDELLYFDCNNIVFKNGLKINSCEKWFEDLVEATKFRKLNSIEMIEETKLKIKLKTTTIEGVDNAKH